MAVAIAWLPGPAGTRRRVAKPSVEEPDAAEPARPDLWGARVSNDPGLPDPGLLLRLLVVKLVKQHVGGLLALADLPAHVLDLFVGGPAVIAVALRRLGHAQVDRIPAPVRLVGLDVFREPLLAGLPRLPMRACFNLLKISSLQCHSALVPLVSSLVLNRTILDQGHRPWTNRTGSVSSPLRVSGRYHTVRGRTPLRPCEPPNLWSPPRMRLSSWC